MTELSGRANGSDENSSRRKHSAPRHLLRRPPRLLTQDEAAELIGCSKSTLIRLKEDVPCVRVGRNAYYDREAVLAWKKARPDRPTKRNGTDYVRRAPSYHGDIARLQKSLYDIAEEQQPMTVRQLFYQATVRGLVPKSDEGYEQVRIQLRDMRDAAYLPDDKTLVMPVEWIVDNSRQHRERQHFTDPKAALDWAAQTYRKDFWHDADERVLIVVEKDALAGTIFDVTEPYDVPVIVPRGYSSISYAARIVEEMEDREDQEVFIYYFADFDPSGQDAQRAFEDRLRMMLPMRFEFIVESAAITPTQIEKYELSAAGRDTKVTDSRTPGFFSEYGNGQLSYELDALPPNVLRQIVLDCIKNHVGDDLHEERLAAEREDRGMIADLVAGGPSDYAWDHHHFDGPTTDPRLNRIIAETDHLLTPVQQVQEDILDRYEAGEFKSHKEVREAAKTAYASLLITQAQKAALRERGYTDEQIREMTPAEAHRILGL
jgi:hypothetical protein